MCVRGASAFFVKLFFRSCFLRAGCAKQSCKTAFKYLLTVSENSCILRNCKIFYIFAAANVRRASRGLGS